MVAGDAPHSVLPAYRAQPDKRWLHSGLRAPVRKLCRKQQLGFPPNEELTPHPPHFPQLNIVISWTQQAHGEDRGAILGTKKGLETSEQKRKELAGNRIRGNDYLGADQSLDLLTR